MLTMKSKNSADGVSPVIGIILMVAVTVALVALTANLVFNLGSQTGTSPTATVQVTEIGDTAEVRIIKNTNVGTFFLNSSAASGITSNSDGKNVSPSSGAAVRHGGGPNTVYIGNKTTFEGMSPGDEIVIFGTTNGEKQVIRVHRFGTF